MEKNPYARTKGGGEGWLGQKRTPAYGGGGGGVVEKVMNLSVRTFWMLPNTKSAITWVLDKLLTYVFF